MKKFLYNAVFVFLITDALILTVINLYPYIEYFISLGITQILLAGACLLVGAVIASFVSVLLHETGHVLVSLFKNFKVVSFRLFNRETIYHNGEKIKKRVKNNFSFGSCELISTEEKNIKERLIAVTAGGIIMSLIVFMAYLLLNVLLKNINPYIYVLISTGMIISFYVFLSVLIPAEIKGTQTDGAVIYGLTKNKDYAAVLLALLKIQTQLYSGKAPSEIDRDLYFNVPLLSDDHVSMLSLYSLRQMYYLDSGDYKKAAETNKRLLYFYDAMSMEEFNGLQLSIVFDLILSEEYEKAKAAFKLLKEDITDNITSYRIRAYYNWYIEKDKEKAEEFAEKALKENKGILKGIAKMEIKLVQNLKKELKNSK